MNLFFLLATVPLGYFVPRTSAAVVAYLLMDSFLFSYQTLSVLLNWMSGGEGLGGASAFGPAPDSLPLTFAGSEVAAYGIVNLVIVLVGTGLVILGARLRSRTTAAKSVVDVA